MVNAVPHMATIKGTAVMLQLPEHFVRSLVKEEKICFVKSGKKVLINVDKLVDYLNAPTPPKTPQPKIRAL